MRKRSNSICSPRIYYFNFDFLPACVCEEECIRMPLNVSLIYDIFYAALCNSELIKCSVVARYVFFRFCSTLGRCMSLNQFMLSKYCFLLHHQVSQSCVVQKQVYCVAVIVRYLSAFRVACVMVEESRETCPFCF